MGFTSKEVHFSFLFSAGVGFQQEFAGKDSE